MIIDGKMRKPVAIRRGKSRHAPAHMAKSVVFVLRSDTHVRERAETAPHRRTSYVLRTFHTFSATLSKAYTRKRHLSGRAGIRQLFLAVMSPWRIDTIQGVQMLNKRTGRGTGNCAPWRPSCGPSAECHKIRPLRRFAIGSFEGGLPIWAPPCPINRLAGTFRMELI
jgi:hypothetical protein